MCRSITPLATVDYSRELRVSHQIIHIDGLSEDASHSHINKVEMRIPEEILTPATACLTCRVSERRIMTNVTADLRKVSTLNSALL